MMRKKESEQFNERAVIAQWDQAVESALTKLTSSLLRSNKGNLWPVGSMSGDIKTRINRKKKELYGEKKPNIEVLKSHYNFIVSLEGQFIRTGKVPSWLA